MLGRVPLVLAPGLIITLAVRHLATTTGNARCRHDPLQLRLDVVYLDIYLVYVYVYGYNAILRFTMEFVFTAGKLLVFYLCIKILVIHAVVPLKLVQNYSATI